MRRMGADLMFRDVAIIGAAAVVLQVSCPGAHAAPAAANERARAHHDRLTSIRLEAAHWATVHAEPARRNAEPVRRPAALVHEVAIRTEPVHHRLVFRRAVAEAAFRPAEPMAANDAAPPPMY